jgi:hypothetical protein
MPLKPVDKLTGKPKPFSEFSPGEKSSWVLGSLDDLRGYFGHVRESALLDRTNIERCLKFADELGEDNWSAEMRTAVEDLKLALGRCDKPAPARARA